MSTATPNAHDWHCEEHDTYGWRGEACRKCQEAPSEITALREQVEKLTKERDEYKSGFEAAASKYRNLKLQMQEVINVC